MGQVPKQLQKYVFKKGNKLGGRKPGKSVKEFARQFLSCMSDEEKVKFMNSLDPDIVWRMAEGNPPQVLEGNEEKPLRVIVLPAGVAKAFGINGTDPKTRDSDPEQSKIQGS